MGNNIFLLKPIYGKKSTLDKVYNDHLNNILGSIGEEEEGRWEIYSIIIEELIKEGKNNYLNEMKYRLTDGENPNEVMLDIINRESDNLDAFVIFLKNRIEEFLEEDYFRRFYL